MRPAAPPRVIQAFFPERRVPAGTAVQRFARTVLPPHPATAAQPRAAMDPRQRPPHPATVAQPRPGLSFAPRPPHPATVAQPRAPFGAAPRAAGAAQRKEADVHAFQPPTGFLEGPAKAGQKLPPSVQLRMERYFGADFSDVRVHVGPEASSIGALAFTLGSDLYFAPEHYQPHTHYGQELLGHELTHVVQQREGRVANPFGDGVAVVQDFELEAEADRHGKAAAQGKSGPGSSGPAPGGAGGPAGAQAKSGGAQAKGGYRLLVGAYMHDRELPEPVAGHSFVAIEEPSGERRAFGFSPARYSSYDPQRDLGRLRRGVEGVVHDDKGAFDRPGVKTRDYAITGEQARAAMAKIAEYESGRYRYSLDKRQCSTFALDVLRAARVPVPEGGAAPGPRVMYETLDDES
ncbi:DUF4157 domain-containing protein [Sorangium sp. So ce590]|uniref:eCIS core domain-containing protein n=1 Tax=Sorangium sp. So ce590 TaxID=3133317 RepID=UPI003F5E34CD